MKENNKSIAERTLKIIQEGSYSLLEEKIIVNDLIQRNVDRTYTVMPDEFDQLELPQNPEYSMEVTFLNTTTIEALFNENPSHKICVLNFASAKNPGGGFLGGASAQEESLARSSSLYASLIKDETMYKYNRGRSTYLYSDYMIYSPEVVFWMNDEGKLLKEPVIADVLTSPAPNKGAMIQNNCPDQIKELEFTFRSRIEKMLRLASSQQVECLILGAWGCGVFRNEPIDVAAYFHELLTGEYQGRFKKIVFAVYDRSKSQDCYNAFSQKFDHKKVCHERYRYQ
jgi:uncharacterized protein (TIGR02452 family)